MYIVDTLGVLSSQRSGRSHGIDAMGSQRLLIGLQTTESASGYKDNRDAAIDQATYAPPELSDPAITRTFATGML